MEYSFRVKTGYDSLSLSYLGGENDDEEQRSKKKKEKKQFYGDHPEG